MRSWAMPDLLGFWLDPRNGNLYEVTTHNDWLLVAHNQDLVGLGAKQRQILASFDPITEIDEIRMVGVIHGLIRIRKRRNEVSVQFYSPDSQVNNVLKMIATAIPRAILGENLQLKIHNLFDDSGAQLELYQLVQSLADKLIVLETRGLIDYNSNLRQKVIALLCAE
jgi:hypothetical protein